MKQRRLPMTVHGLAAWVVLTTAAIAITGGGCGDRRAVDAGNGGPAVDAGAARGRYIVMVGGCNDCHTPGYTQKGTAIPEGQWLTGVAVGWRGPWGTTYSSNLRWFVKNMDEDTWVKVIRDRNTRPPMPWTSLHAMDDRDLRSTFRYIKSLQPVGDATPEFVPPGEEPKTPYLEMTPKGLEGPPAPAK